MYEKVKGVKQDDFKALKFYQKACDLNFGNKPTSINTISALRIKSFITTFLIIYPNPKIEISMSCNRQQRDELVSAMNTKKINYIKKRLKQPLP
jgi:hypothetical protein